MSVVAPAVIVAGVLMPALRYLRKVSGSAAWTSASAAVRADDGRDGPA
jgi:hypothetical protein